MDQEQFKREMIRARTLGETDPDRADYWRGYTRGLRRAYHGEDFGTAEEHNLYLAAAEEPLDGGRRDLGRGYRDGLAR
jgi:hypothetical protein